MLQPDDPGNESRFWHHSEWIPTHGPQETQPQEYELQGGCTWHGTGWQDKKRRQSSVEVDFVKRSKHVFKSYNIHP